MISIDLDIKWEIPLIKKNIIYKVLFKIYSLKIFIIYTFLNYLSEKAHFYVIKDKNIFFELELTVKLNSCNYRWKILIRQSNNKCQSYLRN